MLFQFFSKAILSLCNGDESGDPNLPFGCFWSFWGEEVYPPTTWLGGGFKCFFFTPTWGWFPFWLIFFNWVETTNHLILTVCENPVANLHLGSSHGAWNVSCWTKLKGFMSTCIWGCLKFRDTQYSPPKCSILLDPSFWARTWKHTISLHVFPETCRNICSYWVCWIWCNIFFHPICSNLRRVTPFVESLIFGQEKASGDDFDEVSDLFVE